LVFAHQNKGKTKRTIGHWGFAQPIKTSIKSNTYGPASNVHVSGDCRAFRGHKNMNASFLIGGKNKMGQRGPAKKPTPLRLLNNNAGHRPINHDEPQFEGEAQPPEEVLEDAIALKEWQKRGPELIEKGLLCAQYASEFGEYCLQHSLVKRLRIEANRGTLGDAIAAGLLKHLQAAVTQRLRIAARFGFTPADATGVKARAKEKPTGARRFLK
jgi:phage terminase small subunit